MTSTKDAFDQLQSRYASDGGVRSVFSSKVADYVASRPDYPSALYDALAEMGLLAAGNCVADVGAGTGLLTHGLLQRGCTVVAVEPNAAMRAAADQWLSPFANYRSADGCAEGIALPDASVDLVTAAQAFHWFEIDAARRECLRVLRPDGQVALIWNDRALEDPLHVALDEVFAVYGGEKRRALVAQEDRARVPVFFGNGSHQELSWPHAHRLDEASFLSLVYSRSYIPGRDTPLGVEVESAVRDLFDRYAVAGAVTARYRTVAIVGRPAG